MMTPLLQFMAGAAHVAEAKQHFQASSHDAGIIALDRAFAAMEAHTRHDISYDMPSRPK